MATTTNPARTSSGKRINPRSGGGAGIAARDWLPSGSRRYGQWAAAVLFVLLAMLVAGWLWSQKGDQVEVLAVTKELPAGATLTKDAVRSVPVAGVPDAVLLTDADQVLGKTLTVGLKPGQLVTPEVVTSTPVPGEGERLVGLLLEPGRFPAGLQPGDVITVLEAPPAAETGSVTAEALTESKILAENVTVHGSSKSAAGGQLLTILVRETAAHTVAQYGATGRVVVVQAPAGPAEGS